MIFKNQIAAVLILISFIANAETRMVDATGYYTRVADPELIELSKNRTLQPNFVRHILFTDANGETESHWCSGSNILGKRNLEGGGGFCVALDADSDAYWLWYEVVPGTGFTWKVMKGIGKYSGATGDGVTQDIESLPDGSIVFRSKGAIEMQ